MSLPSDHPFVKAFYIPRSKLRGKRCSHCGSTSEWWATCFLNKHDDRLELLDEMPESTLNLLNTFKARAWFAPYAGLT